MKKILVNILFVTVILIHTNIYASGLMEISNIDGNGKARVLDTSSFGLDIKFPELLRQGEILKVKQRGNVIATVKPEGVDIKRFRTGIRLTGEIEKIRGFIDVLIIDKQGQMKAARQFQYNYAYGLSATIPKSAKNRGIKHKESINKSGIVKVKFKNDMAYDHYVNNVNISTNLGAVNITLSPYISKNPIIHIETADALEWAKISAAVSN